MIPDSSFPRGVGQPDQPRSGVGQPGEGTCTSPMTRTPLPEADRLVEHVAKTACRDVTPCAPHLEMAGRYVDAMFAYLARPEVERDMVRAAKSVKYYENGHYLRVVRAALAVLR